jgi:hypothetical protein
MVLNENEWWHRKACACTQRNLRGFSHYARRLADGVPVGGRTQLSEELAGTNEPPRLDPLEIGAFGDREALQIAAQAVKAEFDGSEAHPVAAAINARATGLGAFVRGDREMNAAVEIDAVGAVIDFDQHRESMAGAGFLARRTGNLLGRLRLNSPDINTPSRPRLAAISAGSRATTPRQKAFSAPGKFKTCGDLLRSCALRLELWRSRAILGRNVKYLTPI